MMRSSNLGKMSTFPFSFYQYLTKNHGTIYEDELHGWWPLTTFYKMPGPGGVIGPTQIAVHTRYIIKSQTAWAQSVTSS